MKTRINIKYLLRLVIVFLGCLLMEGFIFNYSAIMTRNLVPDEISIARNSSEKLKEIIIDNIESEVSTVSATFSGPNCIITVQAWITDEARRDSFALCDESKLNPDNEDKNNVVLRVESNGKLHRLKLTWDKDAAIEYLALNAPVPFNFNYVRFLVMLLIGFAIITMRYFHLNEVIWDPTERRQLLIYVGIMLCCICLTQIVRILIQPVNPASVNYSAVVEYPIENIHGMAHQAHAVMFDTLWHKGVVQVEPNPKLLALENPYDPTQRSSGKVSYLFDYALYNSTYYSYFGLTPVLIYYLPFYLIFRYLPSYLMAAHFFAVLTIIGCFACVWELAYQFTPKTSALLLFITAPTVALGSNVLMLQSCPDRYYLTIQSMEAFFFLTLWAGFKAVRLGRRLIRSLLFILCAVFTFFLVWSRPTGAIAAAGWLIPLFFYVVFDKQSIMKDKIFDVLSYMIPLCAGAMVIMYYNKIRFDSPFDFGQAYQLTVTDVNPRSVKLRDLFAAFWYYYVDGYTVSSDFPWVRTTKTFLNHSGNYMYAPMNTGALIMPISWGMILLTRGLSGRDKKNYIIILSASVMTIIIALMDYCLAGVAQRYSCDIQPTLCLAGALLLLKHAGEDFREGNVLAVRVCWLLCIVTFIISMCLIFSNYRQNIYKNLPDNYLFFVDMLSIR